MGPTEKLGPWASETSEVEDTSEKMSKTSTPPTVEEPTRTLVILGTPPDLLRSPPEMPVPSPTEKLGPWASETSEVEDTSEKMSKTSTTPTVEEPTRTLVILRTPPDLLRSPLETPVPSPTEKLGPWASETSEVEDTSEKMSKTSTTPTVEEPTRTLVIS